MKVSKRGRRAMAVGAAKSDMRRGMKARWKDHKGRRGEAVGMAERALIDKWHREKDQDKKARPGKEERAARHGRMVHHRSTHHHDLRDRHHQSLGDRIRESAGMAAYDAMRRDRRGR